MLKLNLGCSDQLIPGFIGVDRWTPPWATSENFIQADLRHSWPFADGSIDGVRAWDIIEHMPDAVHTMNELYRILRPGGTVEIVVPTTDGRGAWQDPTHVSFWNRNSFFYYEEGNPHLTRFRESNGVKCAFKICGERTDTLADGVVKLTIVLEAVKVPMAVFDGFVPEDKFAAPEFAFSILHASARPNEWKKVYDAWIAAAAHPEEVEYILCVDERWGFAPDAPSIFSSLRPQDRLIWNTGRRCYVDGVNRAAEASTGDVLIVNADDQYPCEGWDEKLSVHVRVADKGLLTIPMGDEFVIEVSTGTPTEHERGILVMPVLSRERYERFGWVFYPEYESMYADNDFCAMARRDNCVIDARHLMFPHNHWINKQRQADAVDHAQNRAEAYASGERIFNARKAIDFAGVPPVERTQPQPIPGPLVERQSVAICAPGNVFGMEWVDHWSNLILHVAGKYQLIRLNGYTSDAGMIRQEMASKLLGFGGQIDYVLWIDDDNVITPAQLEMLMDDLREHPEFDAVAGWAWCGNDGDPESGTATMSCGGIRDLERTADGKDLKFCHTATMTVRQMQEAPADVIEIQYSGFPAVLMRFDLLKKAGAFPFNPFLDDRCKHGKSGEDLAFFVRTNIRSGARYAVDRRVHIPHYKRRAIEPVGVRQQEAVFAMK